MCVQNASIPRKKYLISFHNLQLLFNTALRSAVVYLTCLVSACNIYTYYANVLCKFLFLYGEMHY